MAFPAKRVRAHAVRDGSSRGTGAAVGRERKRGFWRGRLWVLVCAGLFISGIAVGAARAGTPPSGKLALLLGDARGVIVPAVRAAGGVPLTDLAGRDLSEVSVIVLADIAYPDLPPTVSARLRRFVRRGGALLITGGRHAFGSGGYERIQDLVPFIIRAPQDFVARPFKPPVPMVPDHPAIARGRFGTVGGFNDMNPKPGAVEILQYPGGLVGGGHFDSPLLAEQRIGSGIVLGVAFDVGEVVPASPDGRAAMESIVRYLLSQSAVSAARSTASCRERPDGGGRPGGRAGGTEASG